MNQYKTCSKCGQTKELNDFSKHNGKKASKSGYRSTCKACDVEYNREYRKRNREKVNANKRAWAKNNAQAISEYNLKYRQLHPEKVKLNHKNWRLKNAEHVAKYMKAYLLVNGENKKAADRAYGRANREKNNYASRKYRLNNPEKVKETKRNQELKNPERSRLKQSKRRALMRNNGIFVVTVKDIKKMLNKPCAYCGAESTHIDHVIPISKGGVHAVGNLVGACEGCNLRKSSKFLSVWRAENNGYTKKNYETSKG